MGFALVGLLHGDVRWLAWAAKPAEVPVVVAGGISSEAEEEELEMLNDWVEAQGLPRGVLAFDFADEASGEQKAVFDLAWPHGIQEELSQPVVVLLNENSETLALASRAGFRCFDTSSDQTTRITIWFSANPTAPTTRRIVWAPGCPNSCERSDWSALACIRCDMPTPAAC